MIDPNHVLKVGAATDLYVGELRARNAELEAENAKLHEQVDLQIPKLAFEQLTAEVEEQRSDHMKLVEENHELRQQLAASQLEAKRLREALEQVVNDADECLDDGGWTAMVVSMEAYHICDEALSSPTSTEALDAYVAEKVKDAQLAYEKAAEAAIKESEKAK